MKTLSYEKKILDEVKDLPEEQMPNLIKIIRIFKDSLKKQKNEFEDLKKEFKEWDKHISLRFLLVVGMSKLAIDLL